MEWEPHEDLCLVKSFANTFKERPNEIYSMFWKRVKEFFYERTGNPNNRKWRDLAFRFQYIKGAMREYVKVRNMVLQYHPTAPLREKVSNTIIFVPMSATLVSHTNI